MSVHSLSLSLSVSVSLCLCLCLCLSLSLSLCVSLWEISLSLQTKNTFNGGQIEHKAASLSQSLLEEDALRDEWVACKGAV